MLKCIHSVLLYVWDVQTSLAYYRDKLGFQVEFQSDHEGGVVGLRLGKFSLILHSDQRVWQDHREPQRCGIHRSGESC